MVAYSTKQDRYVHGGPSAPASRLAAVTPSDTVDLIPYAKALWVNVGGTLTLTGAGNTAASPTGVQIVVVASQVIPIAVRRVWATGTAATVVALYD